MVNVFYHGLSGRGFLQVIMYILNIRWINRISLRDIVIAHSSIRLGSRTTARAPIKDEDEIVPQQGRAPLIRRINKPLNSKK